MRIMVVRGFKTVSKIDVDPAYIDRVTKSFMIQTGKPKKTNGGYN